MKVDLNKQISASHETHIHLITKIATDTTET